MSSGLLTVVSETTGWKTSWADHTSNSRRQGDSTHSVRYIIVRTDSYQPLWPTGGVSGDNITDT